ncbi:hypothetical protein Tco_0845655 [Tanacetum coccineum]
MAAPVISISSDTSEESVGSHASQVILFGAIPAIIPAILERILYLPYQICHWFHPFCISDDIKADGESSLLSRRLVSSSHDTLATLLKFPLAPVVALPGIRRRSTTLVRPGEAIPFGRPYRTHLNGSRKLLTARKRIRPIPARRLAWRHVSHHSSDRHSSPDSSSSSASSDHSLSGHTPPDTTDADSSTPQRFVHRSLARTPRHSEAFRRWRPSRKRCRSPTASVPSSTHVSSGEEHMEVDTVDAEAIVDVGISKGVVAHPEDGVVMGFEIVASDVREDDEEFEAEASAADTREIDVDLLAVHINRITEIETTQRQLETSQMVASRERASLVERIRSLRLEYLKVRAMLSIERDQIDSIRWHMALSHEEFRSVRRDRDDTRRRLRRLESTLTITRSGMTPKAIEELIRQRVEEALVAYEATHAANALEAENQSQNDSDDDNGNGGNGDGENGNGENGNGGNGNPNENGRGDRPVARECTYQEFMKCQPLNFKGTEEVVGLIRWFENVESFESEHAKQRPVSSSQDTLAPLSEFPLAPIIAPARIRRRPVILVRPGSSSERSLDSSSPSSGPSRKRCRSPTALVPSYTHVSRSIAHTPTDLLPPRKRFRDSYASEDSGEEHMEVDTANAEIVADDDEEFEVEASTTDTREIVVDPLVIGDSSESSRGGIPDLEDSIYDIVHYMSEEEFCQVRRDRDDTRMRLKRTKTITRSGVTPEAIEELINRCVEEALAAHEATRAANALEAENQGQNGSDGGNGNGSNGDGENGNGENGNGRNGNPNENGRGDRPVGRGDRPVA